MNIRTNAKMRKILAERLNNLGSITIDLPRSLEKELKEIHIQQYGDLVVVKESYRPAVAPESDPTAIECLINKWHIDGFMSAKSCSAKRISLVGIGLAQRLRAKIEDTLIRGDFRLIVSVSKSLDPPPEYTCTVRFHKLRPGNPWLREDFENYTDEALLVIDWGNQPSSERTDQRVGRQV
jgi:hypothetical protein